MRLESAMRTPTMSGLVADEGLINKAGSRSIQNDDFDCRNAVERPQGKALKNLVRTFILGILNLVRRASFVNPAQTVEDSPRMCWEDEIQVRLVITITNSIPCWEVRWKY